MGTPAMPDLGLHCSREDCHQLDFLPFTCNACHKVFCLEHRQYKSHSCPNANDQDVTVILCPVCNKSIRTVLNEDENVTWERHVRTDCDPSNYEKATKKPRCPVRGCKEILVFSNKVFCNDCKRDVCVKHRFGPDHGCEEYRKANSSTSNRTISHYGNLLMKSFKERTAPAATQSNGKSGKQPANGASSGGIAGALTGLYSSVEAGINKLGIMNSSSGTSSVNSSGRQKNSSVASRGQVPKIEECPQCRARFSNVAQLIKHVETMHEAVSSQEMLDVCPKCGMKFRDPILLVNHVEKDHGGSSS